MTFGRHARTARARGRRIGGAGVAFVVFVAGSGAASAKDLDGILRLFAGETREADRTTRDTRQTLDLRYRRQVAPYLEYLFSVRTSRNRSRTGSDLFPGVDLRRERQVEPRLEIRWVPKLFELSAGFRRLEQRDREAGPAAERDENNLFAHFRTTLEKRPELLVEYDRRDIRSTGARATDDARLLGQLGYQAETWRVSGGRRRTVFETEGLLRRVVAEDLLAASYSRGFRDGRVRLFGNFNRNDLRSRDRLEREDRVPVPRVVAQAFASVDTTPLQGALAPEPALHDGNRASPTQVNIGGAFAGGSLFWNLGVELPLEEDVDGVDVWLADPIPADSAARYRWEVYTSDDNLNWVLHAGTASRDYDAVEGRFRLGFPTVRTRYLKVVNAAVDDTLGAVFVSEIEAFGLELRKGVTRGTTLTETASLRVSWAASPRLRFNAGGFSNRIETGVQGQSTSESRDSNANLVVAFEPSASLLGSVSALYNRRDRTFAPDEREKIYSLSLTALPFEDLDLTVVGNFRDRSRPATPGVRSGGYLLRAASLLYRDLSFSVEFGKSHEENFDTLPLDRRTIRAGLDARPRRELEINSSLLSERRTILPGAPGEQLERLVNWRNRVTVRPSSMLSLVAEGTYFRFAGRKGWSKVFQADWFPLRAGALQFSLDFREDLPLFGQERSVRTARLRWQISRAMFLDIDATRQRQQTPGLPSQGRSLVSVFFQARL